MRSFSLFEFSAKCFLENKNRMFKTNSWWDIDTGAAMEKGSPMLLCLDTLDEYYIDEAGAVIKINEV